MFINDSTTYKHKLYNCTLSAHMHLNMALISAAAAVFFIDRF